MKILLCGDIDSGKSTLIRRLVSDLDRPAHGYITIRMPEDERGVSHVYLYDISSPPERIEDAQVIMRIRGDKLEKHPEYMSSIAAPILESIPEGSLVVLDELGALQGRRYENTLRVLRRSRLREGAEHRLSARYPPASGLRIIYHHA